MRSLLLLAAFASAAHATEAGLDVGHVTDGGTVHDVADLVDSTGAGWVRINFRLDVWTSPDDATPRGPDQLTWFAAYDRVVDAYLAKGIEVYGVLNDELVASTLDHNTDPWIALFVQHAVKVVDHFKNRVRVFELINEPNDWAGGTSARFTPAAFAKILQDSYLAVKHDAGHIDDKCWQVQLISGPLFSFDGNDSASYLSQVYAIGRGQLAWDYTHQATGSYPLDGVGYHLYVAQGAAATTADVQTRIAANAGAVWNVITGNEGAGTGKRLWVSEYGWRADLVGAAGQAARMQAGFDAMKQLGTVALAVYFNFHDFPGNAWGVYDGSDQRRPSADMLAALGAANLPVNGARVTGVAAPTLAPGALGDVIVTVENHGTATWGDGWRLGAAPGCPDASDTNAVDWVPDAGYANSPTDARVYLPAPVAPGASVEIHVPIRAPAAEGTYAFAARMVEDGVAWFGPTATATATVTVAASGSGSGSNEMPAKSGGCAASQPSGLGLVGLLWFGRRRARRRFAVRRDL